MPEAPPQGYSVMGALALFIAMSAWLGFLAERRIQKSAFLQGYFLGNRGLGAWALALTATVQSGGTFMGFPSLVYAHGWIVALWICGYMVVPMSGFSVIGKRFAYLSRRTGALTVPDLFTERYGNSTVGLTASLMIILFMTTMMIAQFKAGAIVMKLAWPGARMMSLSEEQADLEFTRESLESLAREEAIPPDLLKQLEPAAGTDAGSKRDLLEKLAKHADPAEFKRYETKLIAASRTTDWRYYTGLIIFTVAVVGYTLVGGFLAGVWTDLFQSVMMFVGVMLLLFLAVPAAGGLEQATRTAVKVTGPEYASGPGHLFRPRKDSDKSVTEKHVTVPALAPDGRIEEKEVPVQLVKSPRAYLPVGLAVSFFFVWVFSGLGSPASMVRVMASENTEVIRKSIFMLSIYNCCIYIPLICICIAGRALIPGLEKTDEVIPRLAIGLTQPLPGGSLLTGLILAAPFGAVMATVSCYLLVISSGLVKDLYLRFLRPHAHESEIRRVTYACMIAVGVLAIAANIRPVQFLQALVVFSGASGAATFVTPGLMAAYWRRATGPGTIAAMLGGAGTMCSLYFAGWLQRFTAPALDSATAPAWQRTVAQFLGPDPMIGLDDPFRPYYLCGVDPILWGLGISLFLGIAVSLLTKPPKKELVDELFDDGKLP